MDKQSEDNEKAKLTFWQIFTSVLGAAFGVQKSEARERDFTQAKPGTYIIAGIIFTLVFILFIVVVVKLVLSSVGA